MEEKCLQDFRQSGSTGKKAIRKRMSNGETTFGKFPRDNNTLIEVPKLSCLE